jgi:hypothetical protein
MNLIYMSAIMRPVACASRPSPSRSRHSYVPSLQTVRDKSNKNNKNNKTE